MMGLLGCLTSLNTSQETQPGVHPGLHPTSLVDWQMWFAALGDYHSNPWILHLMARLLQGSPEVLKLMPRNPFPNAPPNYLRAMLYLYHFTTPAERHRTGKWWKRELMGEYVPAISRETYPITVLCVP
jgi:lipase maturation factor 1